MSDLDQVALDCIDNWKIDSLGDNNTQSTAKLQIAIVYAIQEQLKQLQKDKDELVEALEDAVGLCQIAEHAWEIEDDTLLLNCEAIAAKHKSDK